MDGFDRTGKPGRQRPEFFQPPLGGTGQLLTRAPTDPAIHELFWSEVPGGKRHSGTLPAEKIEHESRENSVGHDPMQRTLSSAVET